MTDLPSASELPPLELFVSYSVDDTKVVEGIVSHLGPYANARYWHQDKEPGRDAWQTIHGWIDHAELIVVILTGNTLGRAISVGNEVGYARKAGKIIIPLVAPEVPPSSLGCLNGITYIALDPSRPEGAIKELKKVVETTATALNRKRNIVSLIGLAILGYFVLRGE